MADGTMTKIMFVPFSIASGTFAGFVSKKAFERLWHVFDDQDAPDPKDRDIAWAKLVTALLLQGAILRTVRGLMDHGSRSAFSKLTGTWPGAKDEEIEQNSESA
jgi:Protein of unknown function (DUF4235)